jgi:predicted AAA+ superfamily ATPase
MRINEAIQVSQSLDNPETEKREIEGLLEAMEKFKLKNGIIITESQEEERKINGKKIKIVPAWKWLLEK